MEMQLAFASFVLALSLLLPATNLAAAAAGGTLAYPQPPTDGSVDTYYGTPVPDPYRPLESIDAPATRAWVEAESALARSYLDAIPQRAAIKAHLASIVNYERYGLPFHMRDRYFYLYSSGLQNQSVLYTMQGLSGTPRVLIDPNTLSADGSVTVGGESPSWNARYLAYATQTSGSDWQTWRVREVARGKDLPDTLAWSKFASASWLPDDSGFYYERYPQPASGETYKGALYDHAVYFHKLGTPESADPRFYYRQDHKNWLYGTQVTEDGRYLVLTVSANTSINTRIGYVDLHDPKRAVRELLWKNDAQWNYVDNVGPVFYFTTTLGAPNSRVVTVDLRRPGDLRTVVPQSAFALQGASVVGKRLILSYLVDAHSSVKIYDERGRFVRSVSLPGLGDATGFGGFSTDRTTFYVYSGWTTPPTTYLYDVASGKSTVYRKPQIAFDPSQYETKEVFYRSRDGTRVPMMISYRRGTNFDGTVPTILYGYGGFDIPMNAVLLEFDCDLAADGRYLRRGQHSGRFGIRRGLASRRDARP